MELHFNDLTEQAQNRLLDEYDAEKPEDMNWDVIPITEI